MKQKVIGIIPARYNSTRFLGKLLYKINSKTLLQHTYENARKCSFLNNIYIATEDEIIFKEASKFKAKCFITKKCPNGTARIIETLKNQKELQDSDIIVNIQGDHPKINPMTIEKIINALTEDPTAVVSTAVTPINYEKAVSENIVKCVFDKNQKAKYFSRSLIPYSKNLKKSIYYYHIGLYAYRTKFLYELDTLTDTNLQQLEDLEQLKILEHGYEIKIAIVDDIPVGVDILEDIKEVQKIL